MLLVLQKLLSLGWRAPHLLGQVMLATASPSASENWLSPPAKLSPHFFWGRGHWHIPDSQFLLLAGLLWSQQDQGRTDPWGYPKAPSLGVSCREACWKITSRHTTPGLCFPAGQQGGKAPWSLQYPCSSAADSRAAVGIAALEPAIPGLDQLGPA